MCDPPLGITIFIIGVLSGIAITAALWSWPEK